MPAQTLRPETYWRHGLIRRPLATRIPRRTWSASVQVLINEIGSFSYNDKGEPYASPGCHDDMIFATALALEGLEQVGPVREEVMREYRPESPEEIVAFERETGLDAMTMMPLDEAANSYNGGEESFDIFFGDGLE